MAQPAPLCQLERDKFIGNQKGFVDTFNWVVQAVDNLEGGKNCKVNWAMDGHPVIDVEVPENDGEGGGSPDVSAVYDVIPSTSGSQSGIEVQYVDARAETFIPFTGGSGSVTFYGTDNTFTSAANTFRFYKASNSNIVITANGTGITIGAYYT